MKLLEFMIYRLNLLLKLYSCITCCNVLFKLNVVILGFVHINFLNIVFLVGVVMKLSCEMHANGKMKRWITV